MTQGQAFTMVSMINETNPSEVHARHESHDHGMRHFTIHHGDVAIPVSLGGRGRPLVLCPGLNSTQADLRELADLLRRDHNVATFDLRGHGLASAAQQYSFEAFVGDVGAVLGELECRGLGAPPVLVGYSLGADLAVHYACEHPGVVAELVLIDGANPVPEPLITEAVLPELRAMWEDMATHQKTLQDPARRVVLTARQILDLNVEVDAVRSRILDQYNKIDHPITMIMSTSMAGDDGEAYVTRFNRIWHAGVERLLRERPDISASWLDADHRLVFTHAREVAGMIRSRQAP